MSSSNYCTEAQVERTTFGWTIKNFSLLLEDKGTSIFSPFFYSKDNKEKWQLQFFPRGDRNSPDTYLAIFLNLVSGTLPVKVQYELSIVRSGNAVVTRTSIRQYESITAWGFKDFITRSRLLGHATDTFTISCRIDKPLENILTSLPNPSMEMTHGLSVDKKTGCWTEDFAGLLKNSKFSDVTLIVKDGKFLAHKAVLAARSPVFAAMFESKDVDENKKNVINIEKMEPSVVKGMLEFIYTDNVPNLDEISKGLLSAADEYHLVMLRALCEESVAKTLSDETAVEILVLAHLNHCDNLQKHVMRFMDNHLTDVINSEDYKKMEKYPGLVMEFFRFMALQRSSKKS